MPIKVWVVKINQSPDGGWGMTVCLALSEEAASRLTDGYKPSQFEIKAVVLSGDDAVEVADYRE